LTAKPVLRAGGASAPSAALAAALLLSACGSDDDPGPGGITVGEARALDEAAEMLDSQRVPEEVLREAARPSEAEPDGDASPTPEPTETETPAPER
jgi:hypothetical protein